MKLLHKEKKEKVTPSVPFDYAFMTQDNAETFSICGVSRYGKIGATCCERNHSILHFISSWFHLRSGFSKIILQCDNAPFNAQ